MRWSIWLIALQVLGMHRPDAPAFIGCVVIGRNEGERLRRCLDSVIGQTAWVVYVDSGSTDDSVIMARGLGVQVVELDMKMPFTAARARNAGFEALMASGNTPLYVQFVDGDCEVVSGWFDAARIFLDAHEGHAVVCGRRRERHPERSIYNRLCDMEWNTPVGETLACGGDALMRADALAAVGGYRATLIAGEEPELCVRLRQRGWKIYRLDHEMTLHDAAMTRFSQWWRRTVRGGHAFAEGAMLHGASPGRHWVREAIRAMVWGGVLPCVILMGAVFHRAVLLGFLIYVLQYLRVWRKVTDSRYAFFTMLGKFAECQGILKYFLGRMSGRISSLIEYK